MSNLAATAEERARMDELERAARDRGANPPWVEDGPHMSAATIPLVQPGSLSGEKGPTEETLATEWRRINGADWRYDHGIGAWFHWNGARWARDETREAFDLIRKHLGAASANLKVNVGRASVARGVEVFATADRAMAVEHDLWDQDPFLLGTPAGVVDLQTGVLREARRDMFITRSTSVIFSSVRWSLTIV